jgi:hypothetical protein
MITKQQVASLKCKIDNEDYPPIPESLTWALDDLALGWSPFRLVARDSQGRFIDRAYAGNIKHVIRSLIKLGLLTPQLRLTEMGLFYQKGEWAKWKASQAGDNPAGFPALSSAQTSLKVMRLEAPNDSWEIILEAVQCPYCQMVFAREIHRVIKFNICLCPECGKKLQYPDRVGGLLIVRTEMI